MSEPIAFNIKEAARLLSVSPWSIRRWIREGKVHAIRMGSRVLVPAIELARLGGKGMEAQR